MADEAFPTLLLAGFELEPGDRILHNDAYREVLRIEFRRPSPRNEPESVITFRNGRTKTILAREQVVVLASAERMDRRVASLGGLNA